MPVKNVIHFAEDGDTSGFFPALAKYHDRTRYRMTFATLKPMAPWLETFMNQQGVETFSCGASGRLLYPATILSLVRRLRASKCHIFHAHLFDPSVVGLTAARVAGVPARILTRHYSNYHTRINRPLHVKLDQLCTALSHAVIAVSEETAQHLIDAEGAPAAKVVAIHNGIDFERVQTTGPGPRAQIRQELDLGDTFVFLTAGRLHPEKGYESLLEAVSILKKQSEQPFMLLVAGKGPLISHYEKMAADYGIQDRVRFLGFRNDLANLMAASDVFVLASVAEAFGLVLAEALYLGLPVLATRTGGIPEIVDDGLDGVLVPPASPQQLASSMGLFLDGQILLKGQGARAKAKVRQRFDFQNMLQRYEGVYARVLNG